MDKLKKYKKKRFVDIQRWKYFYEKEPKEQIDESLEKFLQKQELIIKEED